MTWDMANRKSETDIAESTWERARRRLSKTKPHALADRTWLLSGLEELDDSYKEYELSSDGEGLWYCSCYDHYGGEVRREEVCSHSAAVALYAGLPCQRTRPLKEKPKRLTPDWPCGIPGIPGKYSRWRPHQREAVELILRQWQSNGKYIALDAPTGSGKSLTAIAAAKLAGLKTVYCVVTKQLQEQIASDFPDAIVIWGRENYPCLRFTNTELTAGDCTHRKYSPCPKVNQCTYKSQKHRALAADLAVVNYSFFLNEANYVGGFSGWPVLVFDEADRAEGELMKFVSLTLTRQQLERCQIEPPEYKTKLDAWLKWAEPTLSKVGGELNRLEAGLEPYLEVEKEPPVELMRELIRYQRLHSKLKMFTTCVDARWVSELDDPEKWQFKPTFVRSFGHMLAEHGQRILAMSATMLSARDWAYNLGIEDEVTFHRVPSTFPRENRPVIHLPTADFSLKSANGEALMLMVRMVDGLLDKHKAQKGIIHAVSYKIAKYLLEHSRHQDRLISHSEAGTRAEALRRLIESEMPLVLVSPSFGRGVDLFGDRARFQICVKIPFPDLGDKQTAKRRWSGKAGERWYLLETVRAIVQMAGRIVRSADDWGVTYILDERWPRFYHQMERDFPLWFREACVW